MTELEIENTRDKYIQALKPIFFPEIEEIVKNDFVKFIASLLRIVGMEDKGWDPLLESRSTLEDLNTILQLELPEDLFPDKTLTAWRMNLLMYAHMIEMDAPYEVITNLLRFKLGYGYHPNPFYSPPHNSIFIENKSILFPKDKINIIKSLSNQAELKIGELFDDFFNRRLRNAIQHSDFIFTDDNFRCRSGNSFKESFNISLNELSATITKAKIFFSTFFELEKGARKHWGSLKNIPKPYDPKYKGLIEILADENDVLCGFKIHWPNNTESIYRRTEDGIDMDNCYLDIENSSVSFRVGAFARNPAEFSPLIEVGDSIKYTPLSNGTVPQWPEV